MFMIVLSHIARHYWATKIDDPSISIINNSILALTSPCVDIFAMISGWCMCYSKLKYAKLIELWLLCFFYSVGLMLLFKFIGFSGLHIKAFFPVLTNQWWYISCYFTIFLFLPVVNYGIQNFPPYKLYAIFVVIFLWVNVRGIVYPYETLTLSYGYSPVWLLCCYIMGGVARLFKDKQLRQGGMFFYVFSALWMGFIILMPVIYCAECIGIKISWSILYRSTLYISPVVVVAALSFLFFFSEISINKLWIKKFILFFSPLTLGVYLIHDHDLSRVFLQKQFPCSPSFLQYLIYSIGGLLAIYIGCSFLDYCRRKLFQLLKIGDFSRWSEEKLTRILQSIIQRLERFS